MKDCFNCERQAECIADGTIAEYIFTHCGSGYILRGDKECKTGNFLADKCDKLVLRNTPWDVSKNTPYIKCCVVDENGDRKLVEL